jgi:hypothetical protein
MLLASSVQSLCSHLNYSLYGKTIVLIDEVSIVYRELKL